MATVTQFTPLHLTILINAHVTSAANELYADTPVARQYEQDLMYEGLIYRDREGVLQTTVFGKCKLKELLITLHCKGGAFL